MKGKAFSGGVKMGHWSEIDKLGFTPCTAEQPPEGMLARRQRKPFKKAEYSLNQLQT